MYESLHGPGPLYKRMWKEGHRKGTHEACHGPCHSMELLPAEMQGLS